uniref:Uncharacterized protein n=1 Tax=Cacopsylla melanoneura TaxID=428564 RepID=A0A8D8QTE9_9HEMI
MLARENMDQHSVVDRKVGLRRLVEVVVLSKLEMEKLRTRENHILVGVAHMLAGLDMGRKSVVDRWVVLDRRRLVKVAVLRNLGLENLRTLEDHILDIVGVGHIKVGKASMWEELDQGCTSEAGK